MAQVPVTLFAYNRPDHLQRTLACLRENNVPMIYAFSDGPRTPETAPDVAEVRALLRAIDWSEVILCERETNLGLGVSVRTGVAEVLSKHESTLVFEDDLICVPGTYDYLSAALEQYKDTPAVMSVTGWTHPSITPPNIGEQPYFDGRAECLVWGTWRRVWHGMDQDAKTMMQRCAAQGIDPYRYGADLPSMAEVELQKNIWAVRFLYWHILNRGLSLRPPWSMVEHIGFDNRGTNATEESWIKNPPLRPCAPLPQVWPAAIENPACAQLHQKVAGKRPTRLTPLVHMTRRLMSKSRQWIGGK